MNSAANAVLEAFAPPPRPAAKPQARGAENGPSFAEHLERAEPEARRPEPTPERAEKPRADNNKVDKTVDAEEENAQAAEAEGDPSAMAAPTTPPRQPTAPLLLLQLNASAEAALQGEKAAEEGAAAAPKSDAAQENAPLRDLPPAPQAAGARPQHQQQRPANAEQAEPAAAHAPAQDAAAIAAADPSIAAAPPTENQAPATPPLVATAPASAEAASAEAGAAQDQPLAATNAPRRSPQKLDPSRAETPQTEPTANEAPRARNAPAKANENAAKAALEKSGPSPAEAEKLQARPAPPPQPAAIAAAPAQPAAHVAPAEAAHATRAAPAAAQVGQEIIRRFNGADTRFELRLDPPELGRIDVRLEVSRDHRVTAVISADNPQALSDLARHARELEQTLQSAGLELSDNGLSFDLRQGGKQAGDADREGAARAAAEAEDDAAPSTPARPLNMASWRGVRFDVMA